MSQLNIVATITVKAEYHEAFQPIFKKLVEASRKEADCIHYELNQSITDPNVYVVIETWASQAAIDRHNATPHFVEFATFAKRHVEGLEICVVKPVNL
ncbi:antibiotic biosynthesis monooxygenase [Gilliamella sp. B2894]|uniref:putative quinol monooxygenase n=1 Tax=unclassified Gilliamella TaxID=2685620 RepID=UPI00226AC1C8|nr:MULTISPECIES: putative quinol monooxygenase [unclassified Gilliamella]MCX8656629.1 antibiotic biosynthesis monooxygenase [Gilliamella sp. B2894]MCX8693059.1 antibiotic biosynthesis monooxygenase [Gilliamella sp. B2881]MCX8696437.1 antibiotic biosynthesis monooxygenase [Gilliamella sp. B2828]